MRNSEYVVCRPNILISDESNQMISPFIEIINGRHPCLTKTFSGDYIPNDVILGSQVNKI